MKVNDVVIYAGRLYRIDKFTSPEGKMLLKADDGVYFWADIDIDVIIPPADISRSFLSILDKKEKLKNKLSNYLCKLEKKRYGGQ
jgi:hypothetical protein